MSKMKYDGTASQRPSLHLEWNNLRELAENRLKELLGRDIIARNDRWENYHWGFNISDTPLTKDDMEKLFDVLGADDFDRDSNDFGEYPIMEINQGLAEKLLAGDLPFKMHSSLADEEGAWFFGPMESQRVKILVYYPATDLTPECLSFVTDDKTTKDDIFDAFDEALLIVDENEEDNRLTRRDNLIEIIEDKTGCKAVCTTFDYEGEIQ